MLRAAIIGAGRMAWGYDGGVWNGNESPITLASCIDKHPDISLVAVFDPIVSARERFLTGFADANSVNLHESLSGFFDEKPDLVAIASPTELHAEHILACIDASIPRLWIEKPTTQNLQDLKYLIKTVSNLKNKPRVCVNYVRRCLPQVERLKSHIAEVDPSVFIKIDVKYSRGLTVNGVHMLDLVGFLLELKESPKLRFCNYGNNDNHQFGFSWHNIEVNVIGYDLPFHLIELSVTDKRGRMSLIRGGQHLIWEAAEPNPLYPGFCRLSAPADLIDFHSPIAANDATYHMLCALLDDSVPSPSSLEDTLFTQSVLDEVNKSLR